MNTKLLRALLGLVIIGALAGCAKTVRVPIGPKVDLAPWRIIGLVSFSSNTNHELERLATERFLQAVHAAQPGIRVVELGSESQALASVGRHSWDAATVRSLQAAHGVDAVLIGRLDLKNAMPDIRVSTVMNNLSVRADVEGTLNVRLVEAESGASVWSDSSRVVANVAHATFNEHGQGRFGATNPDATYGNMIHQLVQNVTGDFRMRYVRRRVEDLQTASAAGQ